MTKLTKYVSQRGMVIMSLVLYIGAVAVNGIFVSFLVAHGNIKVWFLPCLGILLISSVILQLISAIMLLLEKGDKLSVMSSTSVAILHVFQLGFIWRHVHLFRETDPVLRPRDVEHLRYLQLLFVFISMLPMLFIQSVLILHLYISDKIIWFSASITLLTSAWYLATFWKLKEHSHSDIISASVVLLRFVWRLGELLSRIIALTVFTSSYFYWIFLIFGLHGIAMFVCMCTTVLGMFDTPPKHSKCNRIYQAIIMSYIYSFCFLNVSSGKAVFRYTFFYTIMFFENLVLSIVWYLNTHNTDKNIIVLISASSFLTGVVSMVMHYKLRHIGGSDDSNKEHDHLTDKCINCKLSLCCKHDTKLQRPFTAGWIFQYNKAATHKNYYKNISYDTMLGSVVESVREPPNRSGENCHIRDTNLESIRTVEKKQYTGVQISGTYSHKRFFDSDPSLRQLKDIDSISSRSVTYAEDWRQTSHPDLSPLSVDALCLVSSKTKLLTDSWDNLVMNETPSSHHRKHMKIDIYAPLIRKDLDATFLSEGYSTDHTLNSYQLPVTVLAKNDPSKNGRKLYTSLANSTTSDSTECTVNAFTQQKQSRAEESKTILKTRQNIILESQHENGHSKKRDHANTSNKHRNNHDRYGQEGNLKEIILKNHQRSSSRIRSPKSKRIIVPKSNVINQTPYKRTDIVSRTDQLPVRCNCRVSPCAVNCICERKVHTKDTELLRHSYFHALAVPMSSYLTNRTSRATSGVHKNTTLNNLELVINTTTDANTSIASDSGDSAFPRYTPLSAHLAATDDDNDGISESSCEMII